MLVWEDQEEINKWISSQRGGYCWPNSFQALGWERDGQLVAAMAIYDCNGPNAMLNLAITGKFFPRGLLKAGLTYCFAQLKLKRLTCPIESDNIPSQTLVRHFGAKLEATLRDAGKSGDMLIYTLFPEDCAIWRKLNGQGYKHPRST